MYFTDTASINNILKTAKGSELIPISTHKLCFGAKINIFPKIIALPWAMIIEHQKLSISY